MHMALHLLDTCTNMNRLMLIPIHMHTHSIHFIYWMIAMIAITVALVLAASEPDPENYDHHLDNFRAVCEAVAVFMVTCAALTEVYHIYLYVFLCTCIDSSLL